MIKILHMFIWKGQSQKLTSVKNGSNLNLILFYISMYISWTSYIIKLYIQSQNIISDKFLITCFAISIIKRIDHKL